MVCFLTKNSNLGKLWREGLGMKKWVYAKDIWNTLRPFGIFYGHLVI
jgi:hypothetical protein